LERFENLTDFCTCPTASKDSSIFMRISGVSGGVAIVLAAAIAAAVAVAAAAEDEENSVVDGWRTSPGAAERVVAPLLG
jgi:hypothetical protein